MVDNIEHIYEMRRIVQKAFVDYSIQQAKGKVEKGRTRVIQEFRPGDYIFVYHYIYFFKYSMPIIIFGNIIKPLYFAYF